MKALLIIGAVFGLSACKTDQCASPQTMPAVMAQKFVSNALRSPGTAEFGPSRNASIVRTGECSFTVRSYVDSQNGFGAMLRSQYSIEMTHHRQSGSWSGSNLVID